MPKKFSEEVCKKFCCDWKSSGLSKLQFARENHVSESALRRWIKRFDQPNPKVLNQDSNNSIKFLAIDKVPESKTTLRNNVEIVLPNKISLKVEVDSIVNLITELM